MSAEHIFSAVETAHADARLLSPTERQVTVKTLRDRLGVDVTKYAPWDDRAAPQGVQRLDGWELIPAYVGKAACLMFLDGAHEVWKFESGSELLKVLRECPALEFYVCDEAASYLVCSNHHDFVIGWGAAAEWVEALTAD